MAVDYTRAKKQLVHDVKYHMYDMDASELALKREALRSIYHKENNMPAALLENEGLRKALNIILSNPKGLKPVQMQNYTDKYW